MICRIVREKIHKDKIRSYHTTVVIPKKVRNKINRIPGVADSSLSSGYEICVEVGKAFNWANHIDRKIIRILQENFVSKKRLDSDEEVEYIVEDIKDVDDFSGEPTLIGFCLLFNSLKFLDREKSGQDDD